ncbi:MAG: hypothetical protein KDB53_02590, partial [Planctomycetes bacterium]|nr:hypothetical protein [Planctomycetota bacterium]
IPGGVLALEVPWPGSLDGQIEAARLRRTEVRQGLEDRLLAVENAGGEQRVVVRRLREDLTDRVPTRLSSAEAAWRGARALLRVGDGQDAIETWLDASNLVLSARGLRIERWRALWLAHSTLQEALAWGPGLQPDPEEVP